MPKIFSDADREMIRAKLLDAGKELFQRYGLRKTSVEELARAAGIAKGTFYHFFQSKEDLCLAIYDKEEAALLENTASIFASHVDPVETLQALFAFSLSFVRNDSLLAVLRESGEFALLARSVGVERLSEHLDNDVVFARQVIDDIRSKGAACAIKPEVAAGVFRAFVMLSFHEGEVGEDVFPQVAELLSTWIAKGLSGNVQ